MEPDVSRELSVQTADNVRASRKLEVGTRTFFQKNPRHHPVIPSSSQQRDSFLEFPQRLIATADCASVHYATTSQ